MINPDPVTPVPCKMLCTQPRECLLLFLPAFAGIDGVDACFLDEAMGFAFWEATVRGGTFAGWEAGVVGGFEPA
jgi:hypothetical protein